MVILLPGLGNDSQTHFIQNMAALLYSQGFWPVTVNYRGIMGELSSARIGCLDSWRDMDAVIAHIVQEHSPGEVEAVGWSMGGAILTRYLGESSELSEHIKSAVTLSAPLDTAAQLHWFRDAWAGRLMNFCLGFVFKLKLLSSAQTRSRIESFGISVSELLRSHTIEDADRLLICRLHGYEDTMEYYSRNNPAPHLQNIKVPLLAIHALDDPVTPAALLPREAILENPNITLACTRHGGHIGWTAGHDILRWSWADAAATRFLQHEVGRRAGVHVQSAL